MNKKYLYTGIIVISFFLIYNIILAFGSQEAAPNSRAGNHFFPFLSDKPLTEDGYYMLTVAWNIAEGKGFTYNNGIRTTGVQPLATLFYSVAGFVVQSFGSNKYDFARAIIILSALLQVIFALIIYMMALALSKNPDEGLYFLVSVCVVLLNFKVLLNFANGLETGLYLILLSIFFLYWVKFKEIQRGIKQLVELGILSGLLLLCRLDSVVILFPFYLLLLFTSRIQFRRLAVIMIIALVIYLPWQLYILDVTGNLLQSSARSQLAFLGYYDMNYLLEQFFTSVIQSLTPFLYTGNIRLWLMFPFGIAYVIIFIIVYIKYREVIIKGTSETKLKMIFIPMVIMLLVYFVFSNAPYFYFRYLAFIMILSLPFLVIIFSFLIPNVRQALRAPILLIPVVAFTMQAYLYFHSGKSALTITMRPTFVKENFDDKTRIGAFQTGTLGYYFDNVINLDGKMNNAALENYQQGTLEEYIDSTKIDVLIDWNEIFIEMLDPVYLQSNWKIYSKDIGDGRTICFVRKSIIQ